ncbi:MAG: hypothetical protein KME42_24280 [Tildeniella nuda ZEHNDER 1965/U140]|jgi:hypothetical protein|nr:hypothetical protein [Tildeniella nuda ZEHNDER 1965/U140]
MVKTPFQRCDVQLPQAFYRSPISGFVPGVSLLLTVAALAAWVPAASARPYVQWQAVQVQSNGYANQRQIINHQRQVINFPPVVPFHNSVYNSRQILIQPTIQPNFGGGLSVQIGTPTVYPPGVYPSGYGYGQPGVIQRRGSVNNSVLINPTVINSPIRNSTLINPTIVTTPNPSASYYPSPYYPAPYYNIQTTTTTTRPEPEVYIDPQYGVRYRSPSTHSEQPIIIYPQSNIYP